MFPLLIASALELATARDESAVALRIGRRTITYGELDGYSSALAFALERRGVGAGDRVATLLDGVESVVAFWAIAKASAVGVALHEDDTSELAESLREVDARALVVDAELAPTFHHAVARAPDLRAVIVRGTAVEATGSAAFVPYETALAEEDPVSKPPPRRIDFDDAWLERDDEGERIALSHRVLLARAASLAAGIDLSATDMVDGAPFAEIVIACALAGASLRLDDEATVEGGRNVFVGEADDEAEPGETLVRVHRSPRVGPIALLDDGNGPARVLPNVDVRIVDDTGKPAAAKVVGEIAVRSSSVSGSADYFRTGDSGMLDDAGALYVL
ncbi:MAG TPA: class I adenylate-forming enzyme family protein [Polyangiaceae bacterium]|jgi:acyl-CoA synthetase (AMP-forming)/AMP-acid ligase II